jgi:hypothetical protein
MVISKLKSILQYHWVDTVNGLNKNYGNIDVINNQNWLYFFRQELQPSNYLTLC